jgi:Pyridoxamine 5'-phosphate oxidase
MANWGEFADQSPELAGIGAERFRKHLMAWLGTLRPDGAVRVHPATPLLADDGHLYIFMEPTSPKGHDLRQREVYGLHCHVPDSLGTWHGEFVISGRATAVADSEARRAAVRAFCDLGFAEPPDRYVTFELCVNDALGTTGGDEPKWLRWTAQ